MQLEYSNQIVKVGINATCKHFKPQCILKDTDQPTGPFGDKPQWHQHPKKGKWNSKQVHAIKHSYMEASMHTSCETARMWENFNHWGTQKILLLLDKLWLIRTPQILWARSYFKFKTKVEHKKLEYLKHSWTMVEMLLILLQMHKSNYNIQ